jgi:hypothetical protein
MVALQEALFEAPLGHFETVSAQGFVPVAVERPGGGRIKNNRDPAPADVEQVQGYGKKVPLHRLAAAAWRALVADARSAGLAAPLLLPVSGYRSSAHQARLFANAKKKYGSAQAAGRWVAPPGRSAHQSGRAIDFYLGGSNSSANVEALRRTPAYRWLAQNAVRYGFYPYPDEPWHWEYNPPGGSVSSPPQPALRPSSRPAPSTTPPVRPVQMPAPTPSGPLGEARPPEPVPPTVTLYPAIRLGGEGPARPMTGIFIPRGYRAGPRVDLILYLHGHHRGGWTPPPEISIDKHWNAASYPHFALREKLNEAGRNVILVAPTLGPKSEPGTLTAPGGLDRYLDQVMATLARKTTLWGGQTPSVGNIILAAHSGGGSAMLRLARTRQRSTANIRECWGFDCLYGEGVQKLWADWAAATPGARLYVHFYVGPKASTVQRSKELQAEKERRRLTNVVVQDTSAGHNHVPIRHWVERIQRAPFLGPR